PGASAEVLVDSTLIPLERAINGVQGMRYMSSDATSAGEATIRIYFEPGSDPDLAVVNVQNRIAIVKNLLPPLVQREGIIVSQVMPSMLMYVNVYSTDKGADQKFLYNYTNNSILQELRRVKGVGTATILGSRTYAMRVWLNPDSLRRYKLSTEEVMKALAEQSVIGSPGRLGQATGQTSQSIEYVLTYKGRYNKPEEYENIILKATPEGQFVRLGDVCGQKNEKGEPRKDKDGKVVSPGVELGSEFFDIYSDVDGNPSAAVVIKQNPGSNAAEVIGEVKRLLERMKRDFPRDMDYEVTYDVSAFLDASIEKVEHTLLEAFVLVSLVVLLFLGDLRSTLIPILAVPVSLIGTFFVMQLMGLSINLITLFAMVLAIGIVVDNAIVVVEAVHAKMHAKHLSPYRATREVMGEISGAIIAITLVMTAVFVPVTFIPGPAGTFYRQFGITMATGIVLSGVVALTLTPVLCAMILKPHTARKQKWNPVVLLLLLFDRAVERVIGGYAAVLRRVVTRRALTLLVTVGFAAGIVGVNSQLPTGFIPGEDQGIIYGIIQTPPGSTLEYTNA
ncbi:MAG: efflux RND transporter permease subunit, partial [Gemmataceae bacterium]|nr:efflux RND transporter permease subunit [Gemmataceae bacterium]